MSRQELFRRMRKSNFFVIGAVLVSFIIFISLISPWAAPHDPIGSDLTLRLKMPDGLSKGWSGYILGTDPLGQDILSRLMVGSRVSLWISFSVVIATAIIGTILGIISGFFGGIIDTVIMRFSDIQVSIPPMILAVAVMAVLGNTTNNLILVLVFTRWVQYARVVRSNVMGIRNMEYIHASQVLGSSKRRIMFTQILPNVLTQLIIVMSQEFGRTILTESSLSFLGLGVPAPAPSWGVMIADGREYLATAPWVVVAPGAALMIAVLAFNFLGDGVRDVLDPKNKN
ncbi:ABC transporter permease [Lacrimispora indolis]|uniref:ABC transporter permease n=1 Tax=Lacrimispora indolis TaxID=69825 RepID=UPI00045E68CE|nr:MULTISPECIES: ABC transporter permease [Lachnospiraceae]MBE7722840.1 ABC transporter permease [Lacrimispora celerecrescens]